MSRLEVVYSCSETMLFADVKTGVCIYIFDYPYVLLFVCSEFIQLASGQCWLGVYAHRRNLWKMPNWVGNTGRPPYVNSHGTKGPGLVLGYLFMVSQTNLRALEQSWLPVSQWCVASQVRMRGWENGTSLKDLSPWPS